MLNRIHMEHVRLHEIQSTTVQKKKKDPENRKQRQKAPTTTTRKDHSQMLNRKILISTFFVF